MTALAAATMSGSSVRNRAWPGKSTTRRGRPTAAAALIAIGNVRSATSIELTVSGNVSASLRKHATRKHATRKHATHKPRAG